MSLTGDDLTDAMVPVAQRMIGAVREWDVGEVAAAFTDAEEVGGLAVLVVVLAAMVPYDRSVGDLLGWVGRRDEFLRLLEYGVDPSAAATIVNSLGKGHGTAV
jgi:hypothetical protein